MGSRSGFFVVLPREAFTGKDLKSVPDLSWSVSGLSCRCVRRLARIVEFEFNRVSGHVHTLYISAFKVNIGANHVFGEHASTG